MMVGNQGGIDASQRFFTREDWRNAYGPSFSNLASLRLMAFEGRSWTALRWQRWLPDRHGRGGGAMSKVRMYVNGAFILPQTDQCYVTTAPGKLYQLFGGTNATYSWQSKDFIVDRPTNFGALQLILGSPGSVTLTVYADGVATTTTTISASGVYRLTSGFKARRCRSSWKAAQSCARCTSRPPPRS